MKLEEIKVGARVRCVYDCPIFDQKGKKILGNTLGKVGTIVKVDKNGHNISGFYWVNDDSGQDIGSGNGAGWSSPNSFELITENPDIEATYSIADLLMESL